MASSDGPRYASLDPTLPKPWRGLVDGRTGNLYFWNPETNVTQYEKPTASMDLPDTENPASVPLSLTIEVHQSSPASEEPDSVPLSSTIEVHQSSPGDQSRDDDIRNVSDSVGARKNHQEPNAQTLRPSVTASEFNVGGVSSVDSYRRQHEITTIGTNVPPPLMSFEAADFPPELLREVRQAGFKSPTPIQAQSWPIVLQKRDIVAVAKTGSGKTLGYLIPGFLHLRRCRNNPQMGPTVLVLSPTRELATQIQDEADKFGKSSKISCTCLYGGAQKGPQIRDLERGVDIVVATPGRLNDILEMRKISLHQVSYLVLDEADRMLDMGFEPQIRKIVKEIPPRRQTVMYTATWPKEVRRIAADLLNNPVQVNIGNTDELVANKSITQHVEMVMPMDKQKRLYQILRSQQPGSKIIIFCSTKKMCDRLASNMAQQYGAAAIHGDKSQSEREHVLNQFRTGRSPILVATDVAARGLDIKDIRVVVNYDFPSGVEDYVHRIGRTGRAGATGVAYTFLSDQDAKHATDLIKILEGANQEVPAEIRDLAAQGGGMGRSYRRWGSSDSGGGGFGGRGYGQSCRDGFEDNDRSNNNDYGGGSGSWRMSPIRNGNCDRNRSRSPERQFTTGGWKQESYF
ncbi:hypothetical protein Scep_017831 [Stephania cephalantha]|uniref:RNA helicase n=1 Tax=Stephania cephalantha TaxID=152367 RepID=A0AAP0NUL9_9MAGN